MTDAPLIPAEIITSALNKAEAKALKAMDSAIENAIVPILKSPPQSLEAIAELNWNLGVGLQRPIVDLWKQGVLLGRSHMILEMKAGVPGSFRLQNFAANPDKKLIEAVKKLLLLNDEDGEVKNLFSESAVLRRVVQLAGNFSREQLGKLKVDLISAITPDSSGKVLPRKELLARIQKNLKLSKSRASAIARTELTEAYNTGRVKTAQQSTLVTHLRFLAIADNRTSEICESRDGMIIPISDKEAIAKHKPSLHVNCRSTLSPLLPAVNPAHKKLIGDEKRNYKNRDLVPLSTGWRNI